MPRVYLETTIISYLASRPSRDLITAANQQLTHDWWEHRRAQFELCVSEAVLREIRAGNPSFAARRSELVADVPNLAITEPVVALAQALIQRGPLPMRAATDAIHIAVAAVHGVEYLMTWNCRHLANAEMHPRVRMVCERFGCRPPVICTPAELMGE